MAFVTSASSKRKRSGAIPFPRVPQEGDVQGPPRVLPAPALAPINADAAPASVPNRPTPANPTPVVASSILLPDASLAQHERVDAATQLKSCPAPSPLPAPTAQKFVNAKRDLATIEQILSKATTQIAALKQENERLQREKEEALQQVQFVEGTAKKLLEADLPALELQLEDMKRLASAAADTGRALTTQTELTQRAEQERNQAITAQRAAQEATVRLQAQLDTNAATLLESQRARMVLAQMVLQLKHGGEASQAKADQLGATITQLQAQAVQSGEELARSRQQAQAAEAKVKALETAAAELAAQDKVQVDMRHAAAVRHRLSIELDTTKAELGAKQAELARVNQSLVQARRDTEELRRELATAAENSRRAEAFVDWAQSEMTRIEALELQVASGHGREEGLAARVAEEMDRVVGEQDRVERLRALLREAQDENAELRRQLRRYGGHGAGPGGL